MIVTALLCLPSLPTGRAVDDDGKWHHPDVGWVCQPQLRWFICHQTLLPLVHVKAVFTTNS